MKTNLAGLAPGMLGASLLFMLVFPLVGLLFASGPSDIAEALSHPLFGPALWLSLKTSLLSLLILIITGIPLAWWLSQSTSSWSRFLETVTELPVVLPPAVVGLGLLLTFGKGGMLAPFLDTFGITLPFTTAAVVTAQTVVAAPFFIQAAIGAFRQQAPDLQLVARTLGATQQRYFWTIALPMAMPGLLAGAILAWARALGEFGATLLFAGSRPSLTQTMPLAIYTALESDVNVALALALVLGGLSLILLLGVRSLSSRLQMTLRRREVR